MCAGARQHDALQDDAKDEDVLSEFRSKSEASPPRAAAAAAAAPAVQAADTAAESNGGMVSE